MVVGNPAVIRKYRFDEKTREFLLEFKWWDKDIETIKKQIPILTSEIIDIDKLKKLI